VLHWAAGRGWDEREGVVDSVCKLNVTIVFVERWGKGGKNLDGGSALGSLIEFRLWV
jgi:hypothetical protein